MQNFCVECDQKTSGEMTSDQRQGDDPCFSAQVSIMTVLSCHLLIFYEDGLIRFFRRNFKICQEAELCVFCGNRQRSIASHIL
jgi:hypothetical protein